MGSSGGKGARKGNDRPTPSLPKQAIGNGSGGAGSVPEQSPAVRCRQSFELSLASSPIKLLPGMKLDLKVVKENEVEVYYLNQKIRDLSKDLATEISWCLSKKFRYPGEVVKKGDKLNGQFRRTR
jgi:hypothetical protein